MYKGALDFYKHYSELGWYRIEGASYTTKYAAEVGIYLLLGIFSFAYYKKIYIRLLLLPYILTNLGLILSTQSRNTFIAIPLTIIFLYTVVDWKKMREIADEVGAYLFVDMAHVAGLIAAGLYPNPLPYAHVVTTTTHKTLGGPRGGLILSSCGDEELYKRLQSSVFPANQGGPLVHIIAAKAVCFKEALEPAYKEYQANVIKNAKAMVEVFKQRGYDVVSNGTENHLFLVSFIKQGLTGKAADAALGKANITVNKNSVPNDPQKPFVTSGIRVGTPAVTRRGFNEQDCRELAGWMCDVLDALGKENEEQVIAATKEKVLAICKRLPVYA